ALGYSFKNWNGTDSNGVNPTAVTMNSDKSVTVYFTRLTPHAQEPIDVHIYSLQSRAIPWYEIDGDQTLRLSYDLDENSIVFDVGAYRGDWACQVFSIYGSNIYIFEPVKELADFVRKRFLKNKKIIVCQFGLSDQTELKKISLEGNASSVFKSTDGNFEIIQLKRAIDFMNENEINAIDLMKINIEGGEYDLLEHLIETGFVSKIGNIQVQFHDFMQDAESRMRNIQERLGKTHYLTYQYEFVWENWKLKV
ncbi:MAG: FkbM family methyltransferase, partial [Candidatus Bathyarchaeota archaeon]|nr:FkbM family methyltransferase [Candidatus Bathyarchaeota archaeon]